MKKHEILKYAYDNYPKGAVCRFKNIDIDHISNGKFEITDLNNNGSVQVMSGYECFYSGGEWAQIVNQLKPLITSVDGVDAVKPTHPSYWVKREDLAVVYELLCMNWKKEINECIERSNDLSSLIEIPYLLIKKIYNCYENSSSHNSIRLISWLKIHCPKPKVKKTVEVSKWVNVYENDSVGKFYDSYEIAVKNKSDTPLATIELKGSYEIEE